MECNSFIIIIPPTGDCGIKGEHTQPFCLLMNSWLMKESKWGVQSLERKNRRIEEEFHFSSLFTLCFPRSQSAECLCVAWKKGQPLHVHRKRAATGNVHLCTTVGFSLDSVPLGSRVYLFSMHVACA